MHKDPQESKEYHKKYQAKNKEKRNQWYRERKEKLWAWLEEYKKTLACIKCGANHPAVICFHHKDPAKKVKSVAQMNGRNSKKTILTEIEKCDVLCHNCHYILHYEERANMTDNTPGNKRV